MRKANFALPTPHARVHTLLALPSFAAPWVTPPATSVPPPAAATGICTSPRQDTRVGILCGEREGSKLSASAVQFC